MSILDVNQRLHSTLRWVLFPFWGGKAGTQVLYGRMNQCFERAARMSSVPSFHHEDRTYEHAATQGKRPLGGDGARNLLDWTLYRLIYINVYTALDQFRKTLIFEEISSQCPDHMCQNSFLSGMLRRPSEVT